MQEKDKVIELIEKTKKDLSKRKRTYKTKQDKGTFLIIIILIPVLLFTFTTMILMMFGVGEGRQYATDLIKEAVRTTIPCCLSYVGIIVGYMFTKSKNEDNKE